MSLYELERLGGPCVYDEAIHMIILAKSEKEARKLAQLNGGDECHRRSYNGDTIPIPVWTDPTLSSCKLLQTTGPSRVIICQTIDG